MRKLIFLCEWLLIRDSFWLRDGGWFFFPFQTCVGPMHAECTYFYLIFMDILHAYMTVCHVHAVSSDVRSRHHIPWN